MGKLSDIASAVIELRTASLARASFGIPCIISRDQTLNSQVQRFGEYNDAVEAGITGDLLEQIKVVFSQVPRVSELVVCRLDVDTVSAATVDPSVFTSGAGGDEVATGTVFSFTVDGNSVSYTAQAGDKLANVAAGLNTAAGGVTAITDAYTITVDPSDGSLTFVNKVSTDPYAQMAAGSNTSSTTNGALMRSLAVQLAELRDIDSSWYGYAIPDATDAEIEDSASVAEALDPPVQYYSASTSPQQWANNVGSSAPDSVLSRLHAKGFLRTNHFPVITRTYAEVAAMCRFFVSDPGSIVLGLKQLRNVEPSAFTRQQRANIIARGGNTYEAYSSSISLVWPGKPVEGVEWADTIRDRDFMIDDIQKAMVGLLIRVGKLPYTNPGITSVVNVLQGRLKIHQQMGIVAPDQINELGETVPGFLITAPNAADVDADTRASRVLKISFVALLAGAIQEIRVSGVLTYAYGE